MELNWTNLITSVAPVCAALWFFYGRLDRKIEKAMDGITQQARRSDKLYEMFYDLLKEKK